MRISDWSSDVCSSDLQGARSWRASDAARSGASQCPLVAIFAVAPPKYPRPMQRGCDRGKSMSIPTTVLCVTLLTLVGGCARADEAIRSEERHVGKECVSTCRSRWSQYH